MIADGIEGVLASWYLTCQAHCSLRKNLACIPGFNPPVEVRFHAALQSVFESSTVEASQSLHPALLLPVKTAPVQTVWVVNPAASAWSISHKRMFDISVALVFVGFWGSHAGHRRLRASFLEWTGVLCTESHWPERSVYLASINSAVWK